MIAGFSLPNGFSFKYFSSLKPFVVLCFSLYYIFIELTFINLFVNKFGYEKHCIVYSRRNLKQHKMKLSKTSKAVIPFLVPFIMFLIWFIYLLKF